MSSSGPPPAKRRNVVTDVAAISGTTTGAAKLLKLLHDKGLFKDSLFATSERTLRRDAAEGTADTVANCTTPFGTVVEPMCIGGKTIDVVNPFAYISFLCDRHRGLFNVLCPGEQHTKRSIVLYIDEVKPGNPLRHDKGRTTQCVYWTFSDLPDKYLASDNCWFLFTAIRSTTVDEMHGKVSGLMKTVVHKFFLESAVNWHTGITVANGNSAALLQGSFGGFLGDEKALKEIFSLKGAAGTRPCPSCANVVQFLELSGRLVGIDCTDAARFVACSDADIYHCADKLAAHRGTRASLTALEKAVGMNLEPHGLLFDPSMRGIVKPVTHYVRDWMHTIVGHGVACTELALLIQELNRIGVTHAALQRFAAEFTMPKHKGTFSPDLFSAARVADDTMRVFASEMLMMIPVMLAFLQDVVLPMNMLPDHVRSFTSLASIVDLLRAGPSSAGQRHEQLTRLIRQHHVAFITAYGSNHVKPKFHHMHHLGEHGAQLGVVLGCFVTERKHKAVKAAGRWSFNQYEHHVLRSLLLQQSLNLDRESFFEEESMDHPVDRVVDGIPISRAVACRVKCGEVRRGDVVVLTGDRAGEVSAFVKVHNLVMVQYFVFSRAAGYQWNHSGRTEFAKASEILATVGWARRGACLRLLSPLVL